MIKARTLMKRPSLMRQIQLGEKEAKVEVHRVEELRFLYRNGLLDKVKAYFHRFDHYGFIEVVDELDDAELAAYVDNEDFRLPFLNYVSNADLPARLIDMLSHRHPSTIRLLTRVLDADSLRYLYRTEGALAGAWILEGAIVSNRFDEVVAEVLSDEEKLAENLKRLVGYLDEYWIESMRGPILKAFTKLAEREDLVGTLAVMLLPKGEAERFVNSPNPLKRAAVASKIEKVELLQELSRDSSTEVQLALLRRGLFVKTALKKLLGREDEETRIVISLIMTGSV